MKTKLPRIAAVAKFAGLIIATMFMAFDPCNAIASTVDFTISQSGNVETFTLPLDPIPNSFSLGTGFEIDNVPYVYNGTPGVEMAIGFFNSSTSILFLDDNFLILSVAFEQLYMGSESSPTFRTGTYIGANGETIDISNSAVPLPAALPLFATGLGALGLFGWRRKRKASAALAS